MAKEIRAEPGSLTRLAEVTLNAADRLGDHFRTGFRDVPVPGPAFGDRPQADAAHQAYELALANAQVAIAELVAVLEGDVDRLCQVAFAYRIADQRAARRFGGAP